MPKFDYRQILQNVSLDDVARRLGMELKTETPTRFKALCPFHDDKTPSLLVDCNRDTGRQHYHCFACGETGDAIDLVKGVLNVGFKEAIAWLSPSATPSSSVSLRDKFAQKNVTAVDISDGLQSGYKIYKSGSDESAYLNWIQQRSLDSVVLRRAGFVHAKENHLSRQLHIKRNQETSRETIEALEEAHLIRRLTPGISSALHLPLAATPEYKDFFIGERIVFPLFDHKKNLVGLGARLIGTAPLPGPKYQFTRGFPKGSVLYRAEHSFAAIRAAAKEGAKELSIYLCEGFLDALRIEALGLAAVAVMGNNLSDQQTQLLRSLAENLPAKDATLTINICFDRDEAGLKGAADACLKLINAAFAEIKFIWPTVKLLTEFKQNSSAKDPNDYLEKISVEDGQKFLLAASYPPQTAILAYAFGINAEDTLDDKIWSGSPRSRRLRAFNRATNQLEKALKENGISEPFPQDLSSATVLVALDEWKVFYANRSSNSQRTFSEEFLNDALARLNHARLLAYMGSQRGELPCDEPRWERLDIAATAFNRLLIQKLANQQISPSEPYDAVWVPRSFGGAESRLKIMPRAEDLIIQQYLMSEILTQRWDHLSFSRTTFSSTIPAVRFYREERRTITTGFDKQGNGSWSELDNRTLSFAYQIDMDVIEGRQPATDQGMYRPFSECWREFMSAVTAQASEIGYVYSVRLDVKRYYDRIRRYVARDRLLNHIKSALGTIVGDTPEFAELLNFSSQHSASEKATLILDLLDQHLFGVKFNNPDSGLEESRDPFVGIPQGPVLAAWIGSIVLFPIDEEALRFMTRHNTDQIRTGYARYVDDIVLLADSPSLLDEMRDIIDQRARSLELTLIAKADEIPPMSAEAFVKYVNEGRALSSYLPAWEPPLVGDGESGWEFWTVPVTTDRQSALHLLHNVELYRASPQVLLQTVKTAFQAPDLRTSELPKAARLLWYRLACQQEDFEQTIDTASVWNAFMASWDTCMEDSPWRLNPSENMWEAPALFAMEGLEHLLEKKVRDLPQLSAEQNADRRARIVWLANLITEAGFSDAIQVNAHFPKYQLHRRIELLKWKARQLLGTGASAPSRLPAERSELFQEWNTIKWLHEAVLLLSGNLENDSDPLSPFVEQITQYLDAKKTEDVGTQLLLALMPDRVAGSSDAPGQRDVNIASIALQTIVSIVPREHLMAALSRRSGLLWSSVNSDANERLVLPPLPGISARILLSCSVASSSHPPFLTTDEIQVVEITPDKEEKFPSFLGASPEGVHELSINWQSSDIDGVNGVIRRLLGGISKENSLELLSKIQAAEQDLTAADLRKAASLYRAIAQVILIYASENEDKELVPAWPYIASASDGQTYYLLGDGVSKRELGSRAFVRDGGRALRTVEVPIFEANLWRTGIAVSDFLGLFDDVSKFSSADSDFELNATSLANPARYVLRTQLRKLRGAYADSRVSRKNAEDGYLPATVERALRILETFPENPQHILEPLLFILASEAESASMYLALQSHRDDLYLTPYLNTIFTRVVSRLPLSVTEQLSMIPQNVQNLRRDFAGLLLFSRRLFETETNTVTELQAWKVFRAAAICTSIVTGLRGILSSLQSHSSFAKYPSFDFPPEWNIPASEQEDDLATPNPSSKQQMRVSTLDQLRVLIQHLGHRVRLEGIGKKLSPGLVQDLQNIAQVLCKLESVDTQTAFGWPYECITQDAVDLLSLEFLEKFSLTLQKLDEELGLEVVLVQEYSYGFNAKTGRFVDSRSGTSEVSSWMISQFPARARQVEEKPFEGRFLRIWTEVFDKETGKLLSISVLGEPFASISINKEASPTDTDSPPTASPSENGLSSSAESTNPLNAEERHDEFSADSSLRPAEKSSRSTDDLSRLHLDVREFKKKQKEAWSLRGQSSTKSGGHIRVALLQSAIDISYKHPLVEVCAHNWPLSQDVAAKFIERMQKSDPSYKSLMSAAGKADSGYLWNPVESSKIRFPSWAEHRRRKMLKQVIDSCEAFSVDLLVLPEYSVRPETLTWLKSELAKKKVAVLAGTHIQFDNESSSDRLSSKLSLLWPVPDEITSLLARSPLLTPPNQQKLKRGPVLEFSRGKKYRSIALDEFFRPAAKPLSPLFKPEDLAKELERFIQARPAMEAISHLLTESPLPLRHFLELICSEVFLVSSPANYLNMDHDYRIMRSRFGDPAEPDEVHKDVREIARLLSITGNGKAPRRSILAIPAATSRSADYWIAGQANFLAAGTTSIFCNSSGTKELIGGSCFIGQGSWKSEKNAAGYISRITPYHGWSKGVFYNSAKDALNEKDQAVVIADIDPLNMMEGKPRAQTMPSPLQLVAYLPIVETVDWNKTVKNLFQAYDIGSDPDKTAGGQKRKGYEYNHQTFWTDALKAANHLSHENFEAFCEYFLDPNALSERYHFCQNNGGMQPTARLDNASAFSKPALYDWLNVDLTLEEQELFPSIHVPPWPQ